MSFSDAISESQRQAAAKDTRELKAHLAKNGVPGPRDLARRFQLRELFHEMNGAEFGRILSESEKRDAH